jgi:hypothetical protein
MDYASIFVRPAETSLEDFSQRVFDKLGISNIETRGFPNQDPRIAYVGSAAGIEFSVWETEETEYPFCVSFGPANSSRAAEYLVEHAHFLAYLWSRDGWLCRVPEAQSAFERKRKEAIYAP